MILRLVGILVRAMLEVAAVTIVVGLILAVVAFRIGRRVVTDKPDRLDGLSGQAPWPVLVALRAWDVHSRSRETVDSQP